MLPICRTSSSLPFPGRCSPGVAAGHLCFPGKAPNMSHFAGLPLRECSPSVAVVSFRSLGKAPYLSHFVFFGTQKYAPYLSHLTFFGAQNAPNVSPHAPFAGREMRRAWSMRAIRPSLGAISALRFGRGGVPGHAK